jgi:carbonic anhydrase
MISAEEALARLKEGNQRFVAGIRSVDSPIQQVLNKDISDNQSPFAIILGCSDSRVPAEIVFDQGLGDLFVIRVAGNIVAPSQIGSVEFAVEQFGSPLVVVLGHTLCGAVSATINALEQPPADGHSKNMLSIVKRIRPTVEPLFHTELRKDRERLMEASIRANIMAAVNHLSHGSQTLETYLTDEKIKIVGAEYSLKTGEVIFFDGWY